MKPTRTTDRRSLILIWLLQLTWTSAPVIALTQDEPEVPPIRIDRPEEIETPTFDPTEEPEPQPHVRTPPIDIEHDLAGVLVRNATQLLRSPALVVQAIEVALILAQEATEIAPDDVDAWHFLLSVAMLAERDDIVKKAIDQLVDLDRSNDAVLLRKMRTEVEATQTAADRAARYEQIITRRDLPATVRSRLALDLAILERRRGRTESFATWLAESVALDPSFTAAAALAAGYFRLHVDDPVGAGELLLNQFLANPTDISAQILAANYFLDHGAYAAADRFYSIAKRSYEALAVVSTPGELIADLAIARWGSGNADGALSEILEYQRRRDIQFRERLLFEQPELTPLQRAEYYAPLPMTVAVTGAALRSRRGDADAGDAVDRALELYEERVLEVLDDVRREGIELDLPTKSSIAQSWLEAAWLTVWLGPNPHAAERYLNRASDLFDVSDRAMHRIAGWMALRAGDHDKATALLEPHAPTDAAAALGYANALLAQGRQRSAAQELLRIVRTQPGTLIGVWASDQLTELLGRRAPISNDAAQLNSLVDDMPRFIDRIPTHPTTAMSVRARFSKARYSPYEPIMLNIELTNHTSRSFAIDPEGPVLPDVALLVDLRVSGVTERQRVDPIIVNIARRLRIGPHGQVTIPVDLRRTQIGAILDRHPLHGTIVTVRAVSNFYINPEGAILPGLLGSEHSPPSISVEGKRLTGHIVNQMYTDIMRRPDREAAPDMALLLNFLTAYSFRQLSDVEMRSLIQSLLNISQAYRRLDPIVQAWLLSVLPTHTAAIRPLLDVARQSDRRQVQLASMLFGSRVYDEATVRALVDHDDPRIRQLARIFTDHPEALDWYDEDLAEDEPSALDREFPLPSNDSE
jgi:tetratricopeptide (TPR) repeat protein